MNAQEMLEEIAQSVRECTRCPLHARRTRAVPGEGPADARIMFIGEGPGQQEDLSGRPFVGPAGMLLNQLLQQAGLRREEVFIANIVKCRPPGNRDPLPEETNACREYLDGQIAIIKPHVICLLGKPATRTILEINEPIGKIHGRPLSRHGMVYIPLYHPAAALHRESLKPELVRDMARLQDIISDIT